MTDITTRPPRAGAEILDLAISATTAYGRADLTTRLRETRARLDDPALALIVVGEFKQGKSTLVNALLGIDLCAVHDDIATAVPTLIRHGDRAAATAVYEGDTDDLATIREPIPIDEVAVYASGHADLDGRVLQAIEVTIPAPFLANGVAIVDTPGVGGLASGHAAAAIGALPAADALLFVSDASQELTRYEVDVLRRAREICPHVVLVLTKIDLYRDWRLIASLNRAHLAESGIDVPLIPVSSALRLRSRERRERGLDVESGYPVLEEWMLSQVVERADEIEAATVTRDVVETCDQLTLQFEAEQRALTEPEHTAAVIEELRSAEQRANHLASGAARWQTALNDGMQDLTSDIDHDLRARLREVTTMADARLDESDPVDVWNEFQPWLRQLATEAVAENHRLLMSRTDDLARQIATLFADEQRAISLGALQPEAALDGVEEGELDVTRAGIVGTTLGILRGGYGGMLMFGMLAGMAGITLAAPATLAIGLVMGRRQQRDEKKRQLAHRQQLAKQAYRKYVDAVSFTASKQSRDTLRLIHRELRDHWSARSSELRRSTEAALRAAEHASRAAETQRDERLADIDAELRRIEALRSRALALGTGALE